MRKYFLFFSVLTALLCGCRTPEYYQDQAVTKARKFLLKNCPQLTYTESSYVRYNKPVILHNNILGGTDSLEASSVLSDMNQIQIVWHIPGQENFYAVWGVCSSTMQDYTPERLFVRKFNVEDTNRKNALRRAREYIIGNMFSSLSVEDYNDLRFRDPEIFYSKFELDKDYAPQKDEVQFAFVWNVKSKKDVRLVVIGNGRKNLADFKPLSGSELAFDEVKAKLLEPYKFITPEEMKKIEAKAVKVPEKTVAETEKKVEKTAEEVKKDAAAEKNEDVKKLLSESVSDDSPVAKNKKVIDEKIIDELPEAPELDTENDLKEPEK